MCGATECAETIHPQLRTARPVRLLTGSLPYSRAAATEEKKTLWFLLLKQLLLLTVTGCSCMLCTGKSRYQAPSQKSNNPKLAVPVKRSLRSAGKKQSCAIYCILIMVEEDGNGTIKKKTHPNKAKQPPSMECPPHILKERTRPQRLRKAAKKIQWTGRERPALLERLTILMSKMPSLHLTNWPPAKGAVDPTQELLQHHPLQQGTNGGPDDSYPHPSRNYRESSPPPSYSSLNLLKVKKREEGNPKRNKDIANLFN